MRVSFRPSFASNALNKRLSWRGDPQLVTIRFIGIAWTNRHSFRGRCHYLLGRGEQRNNIFSSDFDDPSILWCSVKYKEVHLHAGEAVALAHAGFIQWLNFYKNRCPPSFLDRKPWTKFYVNTTTDKGGGINASRIPLRICQIVQPAGATSLYVILRCQVSINIRIGGM